MIEIKVNGKSRELENSMCLSEFLAAEGVVETNIAVAVNNRVVAKQNWESTTINDGDQVVIIKASYGG